MTRHNPKYSRLGRISRTRIGTSDGAVVYSKIDPWSGVIGTLHKVVGGWEVRLLSGEIIKGDLMRLTIIRAIMADSHARSWADLKASALAGVPDMGERNAYLLTPALAPPKSTTPSRR